MLRLAIIGAGASGCFAAIRIKELSNSEIKVSIFEKSKEPLAKLKISGGGRCNVTHHIFDPELMAKRYPRGEKELRWALEEFQAKDTVEWFANHGVLLKTEADGRMFPVTDDSGTIITCFLELIKKHNIKLTLDKGVSSIYYHEDLKEGKFRICFEDGSELFFDALLIATGSNRKVWNWMEALGHTIVPPVPSLFTLGITGSDIIELSGLSVPDARIKISPKGKTQSGPLLITHWGFSGPAALRLSAWDARSLFDLNYKTEIEINWLGDRNIQELEEIFQEWKIQFKTVKIQNQKFPEIPGRLWNWFLTQIKIPEDKRWVDISKQEIRNLAEVLCKNKFQMNSKGIFKDEFVTAGGISRKDINFKKMESKIIPNLFFTGEVIDVDGITGGFNFQNAWTTATIAAKHIVSLAI
ncbi:MAG: NAD(P)/FAD-dependent oxidoreductase [Leptospira sp.]|nr:NAD(P)/FAD-dependent oxidoreductase [Leptospira sp.]